MRFTIFIISPVLSFVATSYAASQSPDTSTCYSRISIIRVVILGPCKISRWNYQIPLSQQMHSYEMKLEVLTGYLFWSSWPRLDHHLLLEYKCPQFFLPASWKPVYSLLLHFPILFLRGFSVVNYQIVRLGSLFPIRTFSIILISMK